MRVLIDGYNLQLEQGTGVATYGRSLCSLLADAGHEVDILYGRPVSRGNDDLLREVEFFDRLRGGRVQKVMRKLRAARRNLRIGPVRPRPIQNTSAVIKDSLRARLPRFDRLWNDSNLFERAAIRHSVLGRFVEVDNQAMSAEFVHWTYPLPLRVKGVPNIYTLHDLVPLRLPYATLDRKAKYLGVAREVAERADLIITVSETSRRDIVDLLNVEEKRVINTYQPVTVPEDLVSSSEQELGEALEGSFGLKPGGYILAYGAVEPKKNFGRLIEAYLSTDLDLPLVVAGPGGWMEIPKLQLRGIEDGYHPALVDGVAGRVIRLGYVPFRQLMDLIRGAACVAMPSLYEGFGLPIIEAMACGTAVLTSDGGATAEVAGDAAVLVDPYDMGSIAAGLRKIGHDADLRADLVQRGHVQRQRYSVEACGRRLAEAYASIGLNGS